MSTLLPSNVLAQASGYASDELDEPEEDEAPAKKKRKMTKAAQAKEKAKEAAKKKGKKGADNDDYEDGEGSDSYHAISRALHANNRAKPPVGSFEDCAKCAKQFTVVRHFRPFLHFRSGAEKRLARCRPSIQWRLTQETVFSATSARRHQGQTHSRSQQSRPRPVNVRRGQSSTSKRGTSRRLYRCVFRCVSLHGSAFMSKCNEICLSS